MEPIVIDPVLPVRETTWTPEHEKVYQELKELAVTKPEPYRHPFLNTDSRD